MVPSQRIVSPLHISAQLKREACLGVLVEELDIWFSLGTHFYSPLQKKKGQAPGRY